jgi:hypothetical protein
MKPCREARQGCCSATGSLPVIFWLHEKSVGKACLFTFPAAIGRWIFFDIYQRMKFLLEL